MNIVSVILARGGSKGIPRKNIIDINGKPLLWYSITSSQKSDVNKTFVSTDDEEIAKLSLELGTGIVMRPPEISDDTSSSEEALIHFAKTISFDFLVFIQPTSPLLHYSDINKGIKMMSEYDSVFSGYKEEWTSRWSSDMKPINWNGIDRPRRQDADDVFIENGAFYITSREKLLKSKNRYSGKIGCVEMPVYRSFQLDTYDDLNFLRGIMNE